MASPAPSGFMRACIDPFDTVSVLLPSGVTVFIRAARCSASDYLSGRASSYAIAAYRARDAWVQSARLGCPAEQGLLAAVVLEAIRDSYDASEDIIEGWLAEVDAASLYAIAGAAIGATPTASAREHGRARALVAGGIGDAPLSPIDAASMADWVVNSGRAPAWGR